MGSFCSTHGEMRNTHKIFFGKFELKGPRGRHRTRWEGNIIMGLREIRWQVVYWIRVTLDSGEWRAHENTVINLQVPKGAGKFLSS